MALGNLGKIIAGQALDATKKNVLDAIAGPEPPKAAPAQPPAQNDSIGAIILGQLQSMQRPLRDDQEVVVSFQAGAETLRVLEVFVPNINVFVLGCMDTQKNATRVVVPAESALLVCKVVRVAEGVKPVRVNVLSPRAKPETPQQS